MTEDDTLYTMPDFISKKKNLRQSKLKNQQSDPQELARTGATLALKMCKIITGKNKRSTQRAIELI